MTLFNIWDHLISVQEVEQMYSGPGTERGNFLAWVDMKKYLHGNAAFRDNPVMKWEGICTFFRICTFHHSVVLAV